MLTPTRKQANDWAKLTQKRHRKETGKFLIEGDVCIREALKAKLDIEAVLVGFDDVVPPRTEFPTYRVGGEMFHHISHVEASQGLVVVAMKFNLKPRKSNFAIAVEKVSDPGNCGALIRVADFFGASELILGKGSADIWNGKVVRGSMGSLFHQPIRYDVDMAAIVENWKGDTLALAAHGGERLNLKEADFKNPVLLVLGHETTGLSKDIEEMCSHNITLPPKGQAESLNLVTAAAVFSFAVTQTSS